MKMKRIVTSAIAGILLAANVAGCSAYKNHTKYITLPSDVTISAAEVKEKLDERINDILEEGRDSHYTELEDEDATVQMGDSVAIYYTGTLVDESVELTESERNGMNNRPSLTTLLSVPTALSARTRAKSTPKITTRALRNSLSARKKATS